MISLWIVISINAVGWLLPTPSDKVGWGLRIRSQEIHRPYFAQEDVHQEQLTVALINQTKTKREYLLLAVAVKTGDLDVTIRRPDGKPLPSNQGPYGKLFFKDRWQLPGGQFVSSVFKFADFGYGQLSEPGEYELHASLKTNEGVIVAPAVRLTVVEPLPKAILSSQPVPVEGYQAKWPKNKQERAVVEQIEIGKRTWIVYRRFLSSELGGEVSNTFRVAELSCKVEMKVEGAFGAGNPLTIKYKDAKPKTGWTTIVINSIDGMPWTEEEERLRVKRAKSTTPPAPRPVRP